MIKQKYQKSVLYNVTPYRVMKFFGVSCKKARKLIQAFDESDLFIFNKERKALYAKSFKARRR